MLTDEQRKQAALSRRLVVGYSIGQRPDGRLASITVGHLLDALDEAEAAVKSVGDEKEARLEAQLDALREALKPFAADACPDGTPSLHEQLISTCRDCGDTWPCDVQVAREALAAVLQVRAPCSTHAPTQLQDGAWTCEQCSADLTAEMRKRATPPPESDAALHQYVSTACQHVLHDRCRRTCEFCSRPCGCRCHEEKR